MPVTKLAFEFLVLTATRSGDVRLAVWDEVDCESATWTIPGERMKIGREHRIPLAGRGLELLERAGELGDGHGLVFPESRSGRPLSDMTFSKLLKELGIPAVPHGFRDWAAEQTDTPHAAMEASLAHVVRNATEAAYARSDLFDRRRVLMDQWAGYLS